MPQSAFLAAAAQGAAASAAEPAELASTAQKALRLKRTITKIEDAERAPFLEELDGARAGDARAVKRINVPKEEFDSWLAPDAGAGGQLSDEIRTKEVSLVKVAANRRSFVTVK